MAIANYGSSGPVPPVAMGAGEDQDEFPDVPGHGSPMHPGHDTMPRMSKRAHKKHHGYAREKAPRTPR